MAFVVCRSLSVGLDPCRGGESVARPSDKRPATYDLRKTTNELPPPTILPLGGGDKWGQSRLSIGHERDSIGTGARRPNDISYLPSVSPCAALPVKHTSSVMAPARFASEAAVSRKARRTKFATCCVGIILCLVLVAGGGCAQPEEPSPDSYVGETPASQLEPAPEPDTTLAQAEVGLSRGQTLYVPIYSHIHFKNQDRTINLAATVSIRNTDADGAIVLSKIEYIDNSGESVRRYLDGPRRLGPLASTSVVIEETDAAGGLGANFIIEWSASQPVHAPVVESIMISSQSSLGISFTSPARVLSERSE